MRNADAPHWLDQVFRDVALERNVLASGWVLERQPPRMQRETVKFELDAVDAVFGTVSVANVAGNRVMDAPQVTANLVAPSRTRLHSDERQPYQVGHEQSFVFRDCFDYGATLALLHRAFDHAVSRWLSANERQVRLSDFVAAERILKRAGMFRGESEDEHTAGRPVEAMDRINPLADGVAGEV